MLIPTPRILKGIIQGEDTPVESHLGWSPSCLCRAEMPGRWEGAWWGMYVCSMSGYLEALVF